jgi:CO/xanthine dehydrogenase Mo-binding subunit
MSADTYQVIGTRPKRHDGLDKVTGRAAYGADYSLPGMLHGAVLRSPHAHARIVSIDISEALTLAGVHAVLTHADCPAQAAGGSPHDMGDNLLAHDKALYHGHAVARSPRRRPGAATRPVASCGVRAASRASTRRWRGSGAPPRQVRAEHRVARSSAGDTAKGFADADVVVERSSDADGASGYQPHACVARYGQDGRAVVWLGPVVTRHCAAILGMDAAHIR